MAVVANAGQAAAQQPANQAQRAGAAAAEVEADDGTEVEEVVVTGSLIRGTALDTALPVEVVTQQDLEKAGAPTALEFAKNLTIAGPTTGEAYYFGGTAPGVVNYNLRGIGADKTLTLLNGRRMSENSSNIPFIALARTEVLKDGAAVTYGADAVGGVVNFITRKRFEGLEVNGSYKFINGSDGDYTLGVLGGVGGDVNFLWSLEYEHRSRLNTMERDFVRRSLNPSDPLWNPAPWSTLTNLAAWLPKGALPAVPSLANEYGTTIPNGAGIYAYDFTPATCSAVGGNYTAGAGTTPASCAYNYIPYYNLVEDNDIYRAYAQLNAKVTDWMDAHLEVSYSQVESPQIFGSPSQPVVTGPAMTTGATFQYYVPRTNPYAAAFANANNLPATVQGFTPVTYRAFAHGGNPFLGEGNGFGTPSKYSGQTFRVSGSLQGQIGDYLGGFLKDVGYDVGLTYNHSETLANSPDMLGFRVQEALNGFGGPNCNAPDLDPARLGTQNPGRAGNGGCLWWNPFATSFASQPVRGLTNPQYGGSTFENPEELVRWVFDPRETETTTQNLNFDAVINGASGITLPGGDVAWALGFQWRTLESRERVESDFYNGTLRCPYPSNFTGANGAGSPNIIQQPVGNTAAPEFRGCTGDGPGPFTFFGINPPDHNDQQQYSYFGELQIPVLDTLNFQAAVRHEEFSGGLAATVYKVSGRWNVWGPLTFRASYGTNYQTPPLGITPGEITNAVRSYGVAGNSWLGAQFITEQGLEPETATAWNAGLIWQSRGFRDGHDFRFIVDYFSIETEDEIGTIAEPNDIAGLIFSGRRTLANGTVERFVETCDPAVQPLLSRITFNSAGCSVGLVANSTAFASIQTLIGNGPGQTTNGYDVQARYSMPFMAGDLTLDLTATIVTELTTGATTLDGVQISASDDRLGYLNYATVASAAPEVRANLAINYALDRHNIRVGINYASAVEDERTTVTNPFYKYGEEWIVTDLTYRFQLNDSMSFTTTIGNVFDRDPPPAQEELGYDPRLGSPLGRTIEVGFKKSF